MLIYALSCFRGNDAEQLYIKNVVMSKEDERTLECYAFNGKGHSLVKKWSFKPLEISVTIGRTSVCETC
jgi:hypothetical protein